VNLPWSARPAHQQQEIFSEGLRRNRPNSDVFEIIALNFLWLGGGMDTVDNNKFGPERTREHQDQCASMRQSRIVKTRR
jgi:hypothetical protein